MSRASMAYSIAYDIHEGIMTREEAIKDLGHLFDEQTLDAILFALDGGVVVEDDRTIIRGDFERTW